MWTLTRRDITTISRPRKETQGVCWTGCHSPQGTGFSLACQEGLARGLLPGASLPSLWSLSPARIPRLVHLGLCCPALSPLTLARWQLQTPQAMHLPCRPCCHQTTGEGPGLYYISLLPKTPPTSLARGALQPSPLHWVLEFPGLVGSRPWRRCRQVYQSSSCCLTAGARLPASQWLEFQPFSLLNTSWALPPTHNKFLSSPASWQMQPWTPHVGTLRDTRLHQTARLLTFLAAPSAVIPAASAEACQGLIGRSGSACNGRGLAVAGCVVASRSLGLACTGTL